jgi:hypothetical protein
VDILLVQVNGPVSAAELNNMLVTVPPEKGDVESGGMGIGITGKVPAEPLTPPLNWTVQNGTVFVKLRATDWTPPGSVASTITGVVVDDAGSTFDILVIGSAGRALLLRNVMVGPVFSGVGGAGQPVRSISARRTRIRLIMLSFPCLKPATDRARGAADWDKPVRATFIGVLGGTSLAWS